MQRSSWQRALDPVIDAAIAEQHIVGTVVLVCHRGEPVYRRAAGLADREAARPMHEDAIFRLASLTEPVVSAAVLALVDGGRLSLDDAVTRYLPGFCPRLPDGEVPEIRLRHLLTHTAALGHGFPEPPGGALHEPHVAPGANETRLDVLGGVLEASTGHSLPEVVRQLIGEPLAWRDTGFTLRDATRLATPYADDRPLPQRAFDPGSRVSHAAGMVGTADEMLAFFEALRSDNGLFLSPAWSRAMRQDQTGGLPTGLQSPGWGFGYGGAVLLDPAIAGVPHAPGAWQWDDAWGHCWLVDAAEELTMVALTNTAVAGMTRRLPDDLRAAVYRQARDI